MSSNIKNILFALGGLMLGVTSTYFVTKYDVVKKDPFFQNEQSRSHNKEKNQSKTLRSNKMNSFLDNTFNSDFFNPQFSPFKRMEQMRKNMEKLFQGHSSLRDQDMLFDNWFDNKYGGSVFDIQQKEDDQFVYYEIKLQGMDKDKVKIDVKNNMLNISGEIENKTEDQSGQGLTKSISRQSFQRSFPVPNNVDANKAQFETKSDMIIVKFPKKYST